VNPNKFKVKAAKTPVVPEDLYHPALLIEIIPIIIIPQIGCYHDYYNFCKAN